MGLFGFLLAFLSLPGSTSGGPARPPVTPVQAELLADLEARHLKAGDVVYAKVFSGWEGPGCTLEKGATVRATVVAVVPHSSTSRGSEVALSFDGAQCAHSEMDPFSFILAAIAAPEEDDDDHTMDMPSTIGVNRANDGPPTGTRSLTTYNSDFWWFMLKGFARYPDVRAGGVYGVHGLTLSVATGPDKSTVLTAKDRDVALLKHTELLLIPGALVVSKREEAPAHAVVVSAADASSAELKTVPAPPPPQEPLLEDETCSPPDCNVALPSGESEEDSHIASSISIRSLGFSPRPEKEMDAFDHDETLTWLSDKELLVTFNPHTLVPRLGDRAGGTVRVIRAALVDTETQKVKRIVDWRLPDDKQYLWPLADHRVLVHVGNELRVYGPGLALKQTYPLDGPLAFLRTNPAGETIVVGIVKERHSAELHAQLRESSEREPDENVRMLVLNSQFQTTATADSATELLPPVFLNEGEVKLYRQGDKRFHIVIQTWDSQRRSLARFSSSCTPHLSTLSPDSLFLVSCAASSQEREYRVLRADGKVIVQGDSPAGEFGYSATGDGPLNEVILRTVESDQPLEPSEVFHPSDLKWERIRVYSAVDGKRVFSVRVSAPSPSVGGFAMAPDGRQMAVLTREQIAIYAVSAEAGK
jgi:hypothetical protein